MLSKKTFALPFTSKSTHFATIRAILMHTCTLYICAKVFKGQLHTNFFTIQKGIDNSSTYGLQLCTSSTW